MSIQELLSSTPPDVIDRYLRLVRGTLPEADVALIEAMLLDGLSPWQASERVKGISPATSTTRFARARILAREIHAHFGDSVARWAEKLIEEGEVSGVPHYLIADIRAALQHRGYQVVEETVLRATVLSPAEEAEP